MPVLARQEFIEHLIKLGSILLLRNSIKLKFYQLHALILEATEYHNQYLDSSEILMVLI